MFEKLKFELDAMKVRYHILMMEQFWMKPSTHWYKWRMPFRVMGVDIYLWHAKCVDAFIAKYQNLAKNS